MEMPQLTDAHQRLRRLVGRFQGKENIYPSNWSPQAATASASMDGRLITGGFAAVHDYEQKKNGKVSYSGHGVFRYDAPAGQYELHWFDSMGMGVNVFRGNFEGDKLVLTTHDANGYMRCIYDLGAKQGLGMRMETSQDGMNWQPFQSGDYLPARAPGQKPKAKKGPAKKAAARKSTKKKARHKKR